MARTHTPGPRSSAAVTDLQRNEADLRRFVTGERLRQVLQVARAALWSWDVASDRYFWSPELNDLLGRHEAAAPLSAAEYIAQFVHPDDRSLVEAAYRNLVSGREQSRSMDIEYRIVRPNGTTVWVNCVGHLEQDESGRPIRIFGIDRDISARKRAELAEEKSARFIHKMAAVAPYFIFVFDLDAGRRVYGNRPLREMLGYEGAAEEDYHVIADWMWHPEDRERGIAYRNSLRELGDDATAELECRLRRADGSWSWYLVRSAVFARNTDGYVRQVVGTMTDITDLKRTENELRQLNAELEQRVDVRTAELSLANRELESFAYSVSHDLRAPLRAINGFGNMLREQCGERLDMEGKRFLGRMNDAARRMGELIDALLQLSRVTRGQVSLECVNMSNLARRATTELARSEPDRNVDIVIAEEVTATGDPVLLRIVLENLLDNAWKFTSRQERPRIEFGTQCSQYGPSFLVRDNGVGFDMEHAAQLFAPFHRLHAATEFAGTGIGLATVHRIIARHGGRIWAESAPGAGATFYFILGADSSEVTTTDSPVATHAPIKF